MLNLLLMCRWSTGCTHSWSWKSLGVQFLLDYLGGGLGEIVGIMVNSVIDHSRVGSIGRTCGGVGAIRDHSIVEGSDGVWV